MHIFVTIMGVWFINALNFFHTFRRLLRQLKAANLFNAPPPKPRTCTFLTYLLFIYVINKNPFLTKSVHELCRTL